jgi:predicted NUDIX family NTP pyrophosphohydrolase
MAKQSAGILLYRLQGKKLELFLVHPGGPFWARKDLGAWSIPKGEYDEGTDAVEAAKREFQEETGLAVPPGELTALDTVKNKSGKVITAWAVLGDIAADNITSNTFNMEWPPRSGTQQEFPEVDRARWFDPETARQKLNSAQVAFVDRLLKHLAGQYDETLSGPVQEPLF